MICVTKSGKKINYEIQFMKLSVSSRKNAKEYSVKQSTHEGDSLLILFTPWVKEYYDSLIFNANPKSNAYSKSDTVETLQTIIFGGRKTNIPDSLIRKGPKLK